MARMRAPQIGHVVHPGREKVRRVNAYVTEFYCWEVEVENDKGHVSDTRGNPRIRLVRDSGFDSWAVVPER